MWIVAEVQCKSESKHVTVELQEIIKINKKSEICLFNPFISYIEYSLIYIYKHMGQGDIC